jgi:hypothetical protein
MVTPYRGTKKKRIHHNVIIDIKGEKKTEKKREIVFEQKAIINKAQDYDLNFYGPPLEFKLPLFLSNELDKNESSIRALQGISSLKLVYKRHRVAPLSPTPTTYRGEVRTDACISTWFTTGLIRAHSMMRFTFRMLQFEMPIAFTSPMSTKSSIALHVSSKGVPLIAAFPSASTGKPSSPCLNVTGQCIRYKSKYSKWRSFNVFSQAGRTCSGAWPTHTLAHVGK